MRTAQAIILENKECTTLETWARGRSIAMRQVQRAKIILMAANGSTNKEIAGTLGLSRPTIQLWRERFLALRLAGLEKDAPPPVSG
jgi:DNA-binding NarL/FixJ family response regulator